MGAARHGAAELPTLQAVRLEREEAVTKEHDLTKRLPAVIESLLGGDYFAGAIGNGAHWRLCHHLHPSADAARRCATRLIRAGVEGEQDDYE